MNDLSLIERCEALMLDNPEQIDCPVIHHFSPGLYIREVKIPAGMFVMGHWQKKPHLNIFLRGRVTIVRELGDQPVDLVAPMIFTGEPGRKIGYTHEDVVWLNVYPTTETDVEKLEEMFLDKSLAWQEREDIANRQFLLGTHIDNEDYFDVLREVGISPETATEQSENETDQIPFPPGSYKCKVRRSKIHNRGLFATATIPAGEVIAPALIDGKRTPAGRFTNHSVTSNAQMVLRELGDDIDLVALRSILGCHGGFDGEEITIDYRQALAVAMSRVRSKA